MKWPKKRSHKQKLRSNRKRLFIVVTLLVFVGIFGFVGYRLLTDSDAASNRGAAYDNFGVYIGGNVSSFKSREAQLGRQIKFVQINGGDNGADYCHLVYDVNCQNGDLYWGANAGAKMGLRVTPFYGFSMKKETNPYCSTSYDCNNVQAPAYYESANGSRDSYYRQLAERLIAAGLGHAILRPSWEMNCDCGGASVDDGNAYIAAWKHMHGVFKSYNDAGRASFKFYWNPLMLPGTSDFQNSYQKYYPGGSYVDISGFDFYDSPFTARPKAGGIPTNTWADPVGVWNSFYKPQLDWLKNLALANNDQIATGEWALHAGGCNHLGGDQTCPSSFSYTDPSKSGMDNPTYIQQMFDWHNSLPASGAGSLAFLSYFTGNFGHSGPHDYETKNNGSYIYPQGRSKILSLFGGSSTTPTPPVPPPTPPTPTPQPDLVVTGITFNPSEPVPGQAVTFTATVKNQGTGATPDGTVIGVAFLINGSFVSWSDNSSTSLASGASRTFTANSGPDSDAVWTAVSGSNNLVAEVNNALSDGRRFAESNESNNTLALTVTVTTSSVPTFISEDINQDGQVNLQDFSLLAANFGKSSGITNPRADINSDGIVNLQDFSLLAGQFGM